MPLIFRSVQRLWMRLAVVLVLGLILAAPARAADRAQLEEFLEVTGFGVALDSIALAAQDAPLMLGMDASTFGLEWTLTSEEVFDTEIMRAQALEILSKTLEEDLLIHANDFYASALGQRLVEVENIAHFEDNDDNRLQKGVDLVEQGGERIDYIKRMNLAINSTGSAVRGLQEIQFRFLMAASNAGILEQEIDADALRALMKESEDELSASLRESGIAYAAYTYRDLSDEDLLAYAEALEHPDMKEVYVLMNAIQYEIMANRFEALADRMADLTPSQDL